MIWYVGHPFSKARLQSSAAAMGEAARKSTIWVPQGPQKIPGAAEGPLKDLIFAAKDLYNVSLTL